MVKTESHLLDERARAPLLTVLLEFYQKLLGAELGGIRGLAFLSWRNSPAWLAALPHLLA